MARTGITYDEVAQAATALLARGDNPTIQRVREQLGSGSNTTITHHLRRWQQQRRENGTPTLPPALPETLLPAVETFWQIALEQAREAFNEEREAARREVAEAQQARAEALAGQQRLEQTNAALTAELDGTREQLRQREQALNEELSARRRAESELRATTERRAALEERLQELRQTLAATRQEHQQDRAAQNEQHERRLADERERFDAEQSRLLKQVDDERQRARAERQALEDKLEQARVNWAEEQQQLQAEHRQQCRRLEAALEHEHAAHRQTESACATLQGRADQQAASIDRLETALAEQRERELALHRDNERLGQQNRQLAAEIERLREVPDDHQKPADDAN